MTTSLYYYKIGPKIIRASNANSAKRLYQALGGRGNYRSLTARIAQPSEIHEARILGNILGEQTKPELVRKYAIRPYLRYVNYSTGEQEREPAGWDVWETNGRTECIIHPCDTKAEAEAQLEFYRTLYGQAAVSR